MNPRSATGSKFNDLPALEEPRLVEYIAHVRWIAAHHSVVDVMLLMQSKAFSAGCTALIIHI